MKTAATKQIQPTVSERAHGGRWTDPSIGARSSQPSTLHDLGRCLGNQAFGRLLKGGLIQTKLRVGQPDDAQEIEADRIAEQVTASSPAGGAGAHVISHLTQGLRTRIVHRKCSCDGGATCAQCEAGRATIFQRTPSSVASKVESAPDDPVKTLGPGRPLDPAMRSFMEPRFGRDFSDVRLHTGEHAAASAQAVNALAYTVGTNIVFGKGKYRPETAEGQKLLAHELVHTVQQSGAKPAVQRASDPKADPSKDPTAFIQAGWSDVNELGIVFREGSQAENGGVNLHEAPNGPVIEWLPQNTKVYILREEKKSDGWYAIAAVGGSASFGYVNRHYIWRNLPDPESDVVKIKPGDTALGIAARHYAGKGFDVFGKDKRYVVNALVWVNSHAKHNTKSAAAIYKDEWTVAGIKVAEKGDDRSPWDTAKLTAGAYIWLPGAAYLNAIYEEVAEHGGGTGSIKADLWRSLKKVYHYAAYGLAFVGGLIHGFVKSLWDAVAGLATMLYDILKSVFTLNVVSDVRELIDKLGALKWDDVKDAVGRWADEWAEKLNSDSPWTAGHAHGYLTGYIMAEAAMLLISAGSIEAIKGAVWASRFGKALQETAAFRRFAAGVEKVGEFSEKARETIGKVSQVIKSTRTGRVVVGAATAIEWTAKGIGKVLALPGEIAQYLTEKAINQLKRLEPAFERIKKFSDRAKRWLFGCHSPCDCDIDALTSRLKLPDDLIEKQAERELGSAAGAQQAPSPVEPVKQPTPAPSKKTTLAPSASSKGGALEIGGKKLSRDQITRLKDLRDELEKFHLDWTDLGLGSERDVHLFFSEQSNVDEAIRLLERRARAKIGIRSVHAEAQRPEAHTSRTKGGTQPLRSQKGPDVPEGQRLPRGTESVDPDYGGRWGGERGDSEWFSDIRAVNDITHHQPIRFKNGFPDFHPWARERILMHVTGVDDVDFAVADRILAGQRGFRNQTAYADWRSQQRLTWHHVEGSSEMILVPRALHENVPHVGGASEAREAATAAASP